MAGNRRHRARVKSPCRREGVSGYRVDVWRSVAVLVRDDSSLSDGARRLLAASLIDIFSRGMVDSGIPPMPFALNETDAFVETLRTLRDNGLLGVEDGVAYLGAPSTNALGQVACVRVPPEERSEFLAALRGAWNGGGV